MTKVIVNDNEDFSNGVTPVNFLDRDRKATICEKLKKVVQQITCDEHHDKNTEVLIEFFYNKQPYYRVEVREACCADMKSKIEKSCKVITDSYKPDFF